MQGCYRRKKYDLRISLDGLQWRNNAELARRDQADVASQTHNIRQRDTSNRLSPSVNHPNVVQLVAVKHLEKLPPSTKQHVFRKRAPSRTFKKNTGNDLDEGCFLGYKFGLE